MTTRMDKLINGKAVIAVRVRLREHVTERWTAVLDERFGFLEITDRHDA